jgi:starch-binding outer membrane protein, SusD/RagB family
MRTKYFILSITILILSACNESWLEPKPLSINTPENIYIDKAGMDAILLSLRRELRNELIGIVYNSNPLLIEMIASDLGVAAIQDNDKPINWDIFVTPTEISNVSEFSNWTIAWSPIRDANVVISRIDNAKWNSENEKNEILAEAYFHRAYWYYKLVHQFGDVPFMVKEYTEPRIDFYTHSRNAILNKIQTDLEFAVNWLPEKVNPGKINRAAGNHLLTKVYLANSQFSKAVNSASSVIESGSYTLMSNRFGKVAHDNRFNVIWDLHQRENKSITENTEGILVTQDKYGFPGAQTNGTKTMRNYTPWWSHSIWLKDPDGLRACVDTRYDPQVLAFGRGVGYFRPSNYFNYDIWANSGDDLRHDTDTNWISTNKILINNPRSRFFGQPVDIIDCSSPRDSFQAYFPWPQYKIYVEDELVPHQPRGGNSDWYIFRLAETYLLRAEAYYWLGELTNATTDINKVRERAKAPSAIPNDINIDYILDERARELYLEEPRKTELTRIAIIMAENNINGYSINNFHEKNYWFDRVIEKNTFYNTEFIAVFQAWEFKISPYHVFWPIPQSTIDANAAGRINQNKGYFGAERNIPPKTEISEND